MRGVIGIFDKICPMHWYDNTPSPNGPMFLFLYYYAWDGHKNGCAGHQFEHDAEKGFSNLTA